MSETLTAISRLSDAELLAAVHRRGLSVAKVSPKIQAIVDFVREHPGCQNRAIRKVVGASKYATSTRLARARDMGLLLSSGNGPSTTWWPEIDLTDEDVRIARTRLAGDVVLAKQPQFTRRLDVVVLAHAVRDGASVLIVGASDARPSLLDSLDTVTLGPAVLVAP